MNLLRVSAVNQLQSNQGFALIEILLAIGIFILLAAIVAPVGLDFYLNYQLVSETRLLTSVLSQARNLAMVNYNQSSHGVYIGSDNFVLFQGGSYASREVSQDRAFPRATAVGVTGPGELVFAALSGRTASTTLTMSDSRKTNIIYINEEGTITF